MLAYDTINISNNYSMLFIIYLKPKTNCTAYFTSDHEIKVQIKIIFVWVIINHSQNYGSAWLIKR